MWRENIGREEEGIEMGGYYICGSEIFVVGSKKNYILFSLGAFGPTGQYKLSNDNFDPQPNVADCRLSMQTTV